LDHHAHVAGDEALQVDGIVLGGGVGVHPVGDPAHLCEGCLHLWALQSVPVEIHDGGTVCRRADTGEGSLEFLPIIGAGPAIGDRICDPSRLHLLGKRVEFGPCDGNLVGFGLVHRPLGEKQHVGAVDLQWQRNPLAARLMQSCKVWGDYLFVAGGGDEGVEVHSGGDLRPSGNLRALELRTGRWITGHDLGAQLVHHLGCEPGHGRVLPSATLLLEFLAERRYGRPVTARRPL
jgi:hypothetical protein